MNEELEMSLRVLAAAGFGAAIGLERELWRKPAGLRTHTLVCMAAALATSAWVMMSASTGIDSTHLPAAVVAGIGFIGGGTVIQVRGAVKGLTTAATILMAACVGIAVGAGFYILALTGSILTVITALAFIPVKSVEVPADHKQAARKSGKSD